MAFRKTLAQRLFNITKVSTQTLANCRISSSTVRTRAPPDPDKASIVSDPGDGGIFRRFLHKRSASLEPVLRPLSVGENLMGKLKSMGIAQDRIRFDGLSPPPPAPTGPADGLTVEDARKLLRVAQLEAVKARLREIQKSWIPYSDFVRVCGEGSSDSDQGLRLAKTLDESGNVIVLGNVVFLRPDQVAKAIQSLIPIPGGNPDEPRRREELAEMEKQRAEIDKKVDAMVRRELWCGLGFVVAQTAGFMRLTFWELSWDVMEPICFYVTSMYCMAGYAFFLRTSKEPSFEGFYQSRFDAKQKRLMEAHNFDIARYNELRRACYQYQPNSSSSEQAAAASSAAPLFRNGHQKLEFSGLNQ
ncbi:calcium uniporter protein 2, mitochondrial-like [Corylus avellana]|uniref:calcium uniporter protein 2, mitochondrial-like n=1 Tax=Corylus avellana TaxID=13451 RepID=UPI001E231318|nr:calcium uniporter protein 2, mitochondrial-like [Corylus avellana]